MKIKVRTIIKNLATILLLPITLFFIILPLIYLRLPFECWIQRISGTMLVDGKYIEVKDFILWRETIEYEIFYSFLPLIGLCLLIVSILIKNKTKKNKIRNISILSMAITNAYVSYRYGFELLQMYFKYGNNYYYPSLENMLLEIWIPLFALILLAIYCLMWLAEQSKGKIMIVNE